MRNYVIRLRTQSPDATRERNGHALVRRDTAAKRGGRTRSCAGAVAPGGRGRSGVSPDLVRPSPPTLPLVVRRGAPPSPSVFGRARANARDGAVGAPRASTPGAPSRLRGIRRSRSTVPRHARRARTARVQPGAVGRGSFSSSSICPVHDRSPFAPCRVSFFRLTPSRK